MYYFAYGSNLESEQLKERVGHATAIGTVALNNYAMRFNKRSVDGSGKANIENDDASSVEGVIFDFTEDQFMKMDKFEKGYHRKLVSLQLSNQEVEATTYIADSDKIDNSLVPTMKYLETIIRGAKDSGLSDVYREKLAAYSSSR